eukprot:3490329-Rhodomonas_salina.2
MWACRSVCSGLRYLLCSLLCGLRYLLCSALRYRLCSALRYLLCFEVRYLLLCHRCPALRYLLPPALLDVLRLNSATSYALKLRYLLCP